MYYYFVLFTFNSANTTAMTLDTQNGQTRISPRVYKVVVLGDGGVGKSGKKINLVFVLT